MGRVGGPCLSTLSWALSSFRGQARLSLSPSGHPEMAKGGPLPGASCGGSWCPHTHCSVPRGWGRKRLAGGAVTPTVRTMYRLAIPQGLPLPPLAPSSFLVGVGAGGRQKPVGGPQVHQIWGQGLQSLLAEP